MLIELIDADNAEARATVRMDETPLPGDEMQLGPGGTVLRALRRRYVFADNGVLAHVQVLFRPVSSS